MQALLPIYCLGDSHVEYLQRAARHHLFLPRRVDGCEVGGATAVGMRNPNALTNAIQHFRNWLDGKDKNAIIVVHLGEVDCGYVIWYRAAKYGESVDYQLGQSIDSYFEFIDRLIAEGRTRIVVTGATLPTISDTDQIGEVVKKRSAVKVSQRDRTELTILYNSRLKSKAAERNLVYADITEDVIDPETNLVRTSFRNPDPRDHHMNYDLAAVAWSERLNPCFDAYDRKRSPMFEARSTSRSYAKGLALPSDAIPPHLKVAIEEGDLFSGAFDGFAGEFIVASNGFLNGSPLAGRIRLLHKAHWQIVQPSALIRKWTPVRLTGLFPRKPTFAVFG